MADGISALALLKSTLDLGAAIANTADTAKRQAQLIDFQKVITQAYTTSAELQLSNSALLADKYELEKECVRLKDWSAEKQNYEALEISTGLFAYVAKENVKPLQSAHKYCATCFDNGVKTLLQQQRVQVGHKLSLICTPCKSTLVFTEYLAVTK